MLIYFMFTDYAATTNKLCCYPSRLPIYTPGQGEADKVQCYAHDAQHIDPTELKRVTFFCDSYTILLDHVYPVCVLKIYYPKVK